MRYHYTIVLPVLLLASCLSASAERITANNKRLDYMGRIKQTDSAAILSWPGSSVTITFEGTALEATLRDEKGENYYYAIVDNGTPVKLHPDASKKSYTLANRLKKKKHTVCLYKLTESRSGRTWLYGFSVGGTAITPPAHKRRIEFYGNSITVGYAVDDTVEDRGAAEFCNNYYSYASITARHYKASYNCIAKSGIGLMISWFPIIMPEMYDRVEEMDSVSKWDFKKFTSDVVVIDIGQNDSWLVNMPESAQFKSRFGTEKPTKEQIIAAYKTFLSSIRKKYPGAQIVVTLGSMDAVKEGSEWPAIVTRAVAELHDKKIHTHFFALNPGKKHPKRSGQATMAKDLIGFINGVMKW